MEENKTKKCFFKKLPNWVIPMAIGIVIGALIMFILWVIGIPTYGNETIATVKQGRITKNKVYKEIKNYFPVSYILDIVDKQILDKKYKLTEEQKEEVKEQADYYINMYAMYYGYTEETFLKENGFSSKEEFVEYLGLDKKREIYYGEYLANNVIAKEEIENYYNENVYGEINSKHMLVQVTDTLKDEDANKLAKEIIAKLDSGEDFDTVAQEYTGKIVFEELGYNGFDSGLAQEYQDASKALEVGTYSKEPVKTDFGYHIIYKIDQKEKPTLEEMQGKIATTLAANLGDQTLQYKALISLREESKLKFKDKKYKEAYKEYCDQVNAQTESAEQVSAE